ncbi:MAG TPA: electron transport complex subunit RsxC [Firmicutes bacterium]|nr:electron transport complex subunit RsxC [Bacillota bacterium]
MAVKGFRGGVHPPTNKHLTEDKPIRKASEPARAIVLLSQHTGAPCEPLVKVGDYVKVGQKIGDSKAFVSASVHSPVSGKVASIEPWIHPALGKKVPAVIIDSDGQSTLHESVTPKGSAESLSQEEIRAIIRESGLVGLGGACFPTAVKVSPPKGKTIDTFLLNGAECEPYLTADHRIMLERADLVVEGAKALMRAAGVRKGIICIEDNKADAVKAVERALRGVSGLEIAVLPTHYPQGAEKQLIKAVLGREVPPPPGLPLDVGVVVSNVGTAAALATTLRTGLPLISRIVTVTGQSVVEPSNLEVKIGTLFSSVIQDCGGLKGEPGKLIMGGPMMGVAQYTMEAPVVKGTSGLLVMSPEEAREEEGTNCIRCGRCVEACPVNLMPLFIRAYTEAGKWDMVERYDAFDCIECGCCAYVCPAKIPLVQWIRLGKNELMSRRKGGK